MSHDLVTNPDKILYPESKITKQDLAEFYIKIHEWILPHVINRPLTLVRCPDGITKECFFQKHAENIPNIYSTKKESWIYIKDLEGLIGLVQLGVIEIHAWGSTIENIEKPDRIIFDLDPHESITWVKIQDAAVLIKKQLVKIGLQSFLKTSGNKGLHIVIPIVPELGWSDIKDFSHAFANMMEDLYPEIFITNMSKAKRPGKIFLDYLRNGRGATAVIAYSLRSKPHAPISTPIRWDELTPKITANFYTLKNLSQRIKHLKSDPWAELFALKQKLKI